MWSGYARLRLKDQRFHKKNTFQTVLWLLDSVLFKRTSKIDTSKEKICHILQFFFDKGEKRCDQVVYIYIIKTISNRREYVFFDNVYSRTSLQPDISFRSVTNFFYISFVLRSDIGYNTVRSCAVPNLFSEFNRFFLVIFVDRNFDI